MVLVFKKVHIYTTSLVLCLLGLHLLVQGVYVQSLLRELRFLALWPRNQNGTQTWSL